MPADSNEPDKKIDADFLRLALKALASIHVDMLRVYHDYEKKLKAVFPATLTVPGITATPVGAQFSFARLMSICKDRTHDVNSLTGEDVARILSLPENEASTHSFIMAFDTYYESLKDLSNALYISSNPSLVAFMCVKVHNNLGVNLNLFAHPDLLGLDQALPDEYHRLYKAMEAFKGGCQNMPALERAWDQRIEYPEILEWSTNHWLYTLRKGAATALPSAPSLWNPLNLLELGSITTPASMAATPGSRSGLKVMTRSDLFKRFRSKHTTIVFFSESLIFFLAMTVRTGMFSEAAILAQNRPPAPQINQWSPMVSLGSIPPPGSFPPPSVPPSATNMDIGTAQRSTEETASIIRLQILSYTEDQLFNLVTSKIFAMLGIVLL